MLFQPASAAIRAAEAHGIRRPGARIQDTSDTYKQALDRLQAVHSLSEKEEYRNNAVQETSVPDTFPRGLKKCG